MLIHPVSGEIKQLQIEDFLLLTDSSETKTGIKQLIEFYGGAACFEVSQMNSSSFGDRSFVAIGGESIPTPEDLQQYKLGNVPSNFAYPVAYCLRD